MRWLLSVMMGISGLAYGLRADLSGPAGIPDGRVDLYDFVVFASEWMQENTMGLGPELVTNGGFDTDTDWTEEAVWSITGGQAVYTHAEDPPSGYIQQSLSIVAGTSYQVSFDILQVDAGISVTPFLGGAAGGVFVETGHVDLIVVAEELDSALKFLGEGISAGTNVIIDNVSVRKIVPGGLPADLIYQMHEEEP